MYVGKPLKMKSNNIHEKNVTGGNRLINGRS